MTPAILNTARANEIAHSNETALATMEELSARQRNRKYSNIEKTRKQLVQKQLKIVESDYVKYWKDMASAGFGSIVYGRKGNPDRFAWNYNLKDVAKAALGVLPERLSPEGVSQVLTPVSMAPKPVKRRGRPAGARNKAKLNKSTIKLLIAELTKTLNNL